MKIVKADTWRDRYRLEEPYTIAYESSDSAELVFFRLETDGHAVGMGCASPSEAVTGETAAACHAALGAIAAGLAGEDPLTWRRLLSSREEALRPVPAALAALDMALLDILGQTAGLPLHRLLGGYRAAIETSVTIGILPEADTLARARHWLGQGFTCLKLKGGADWEGDAARVLKVRELSAAVKIRFDANQGYGVEETLRFARAVQRAGVEFIEQPTPVAKPAWLRETAARCEVPVMADESIVEPFDALDFLRPPSIDHVNVKLMKAGGIARATELAGLAGRAGAGVMVGCMDESALGIAAGLHFALSSPWVKFADLDGHIGVIGDPYAGAVVLEGGKLRARDLPGLGWKQ